MITWDTPPIVGGTVLIIERIESQNFVTGVSGWAIFADGTAEFLDILVRGSLITGVPPNERIEINGSSYPNEIAFYTGHASELAPGRITPSGAGTNVGSLELNSPQLAGANFAEFELGSNVLTGLSSCDLDCDDFDVFTDTTDIGAGTLIRMGDFSSWIEIEAPGIGDPELHLRRSGHDGFTTPTMLNSWVDFGATYQPVGYRLDPDGYVTLRGLVKNGTAANAVMFTLPAGLRPRGLAHTQTSTANDALCRIFVSTTGNVNAAIGGSTVWTSLNGIRFPVF